MAPFRSRFVKPGRRFQPIVALRSIFLTIKYHLLLLLLLLLLLIDERYLLITLVQEKNVKATGIHSSAGSLTR